MILSEQERNAKLISRDEYVELIAAGWNAVVVYALAQRGFRESCPVIHADRSETPTFLRQTTLPHIHIALEKTATLEDLDTAIYEAGEKARHQYLADKYHAFTDCMKAWHRPQRTDDHEARITKLEARIATNNQQPKPSAP